MAAPSAPEAESKNLYRMRTFQSTLNLLAHILIGIVVGSCLLFSFRNGLPIGATPVHIVLCVLGVSFKIVFFLISQLAFKTIHETPNISTVNKLLLAITAFCKTILEHTSKRYLFVPKYFH